MDEPVSIMQLKRFVSDWAFEHKAIRRRLELDEGQRLNHSRRVAIIGSGPAGLSAARDLADKGYSVTVFESQSEPGGMLRFGIPEFRLSRERLRWDLENILSEGIELKTNHKVENLDSLFKNGFQAVFIAIGAHRGKKLSVLKDDSQDVLIGTEFLQEVAAGKKTRLKEKVLVVGGGNVAMDVARTAVRLGAKEVRAVCLESRETMPAETREIKEAEEEGISLFPSRMFLGIVSHNGKVTGIKCEKIEFHGFDEHGLPDFESKKGTEHTIEADTVIFAIGQAPEVPFFDEGIELTRGGNIKVNEETLETSRPGVFAGGDVVTGTKFIVDAIAAGQRAATSIDRFLNGLYNYRMSIEPSRREPVNIALFTALSILLFGRQLRLTLSRPGLACQTGTFPVFSGASGQLRDDGPFLEATLPSWPESIVPDTPNAPSSTGCSSTISTASSRSMSIASRRSTASCGRSSRKSWSATWTAATRTAGSPASAVPTVTRNTS